MKTQNAQRDELGRAGLDQGEVTRKQDREGSGTHGASLCVEESLVVDRVAAKGREAFCENTGKRNVIGGKGMGAAYGRTERGRECARIGARSAWEAGRAQLGAFGTQSEGKGLSSGCVKFGVWGCEEGKGTRRKGKASAGHKRPWKGVAEKSLRGGVLSR
ncbi:hypothetical protein ERJ75_001514900 [Trypanosoma vivax]|nr:hypothetical protein ERJ75_001514900 [Trypanosoma vivax]